MDMEAVALVVAAVVGSTGLASLITGGVQLSRASRLKKAVHDMSEIVALHESGTSESDAAKYALKVLTLDLVAIRVVRVGARAALIIFGIVVGILAVAMAIFMPGGAGESIRHDSTMLLAGALLAGSYTVTLVGAFVYLLRGKRERLVAQVLQDGFRESTVLIESPPLRTERVKTGNKAKRRGT